jgi:16S rRNA C967 or C1407 C5-methylase (RsmB/RsmF family)
MFVNAPQGQRPKFLEDMSLTTLESHHRYQKLLICTAIELLKQGGVLVYSTCTINPLENEGIVKFVLEKFQGKLELERYQLPHKSSNSLSQSPWIMGESGLTRNTGLSESEAALCQRFDPNKADTNGNYNLCCD